MKKFISILTLQIFCMNIVWGGVTRSTIWQIDPGATAGNLNGCAFDPATLSVGTDYSMQQTAQQSYTDLLLGAAGNTVTSAAHPFTTDLVGNALHITAGAGFTITGKDSWHMITAVDGSNVATLLTSAGTGGSSNGTGKVGGACSMNSTLDLDMFQNFNTSNTVWVRNNGTITLGEGLTPGVTGTAVSPVNMIGYGKVRGDNPNFSTAPFINAGANAVTLNNYFNLANLDWTMTSNGGSGAGTGAIIKNVRMVNTSGVNGRIALGVANGSQKIIGGAFSSQNGDGINLNTSGSNRIIGNQIYNSSIGVNSGNGTAETIWGNVFSTIYSSAIRMGDSVSNYSIAYNTFAGSAAPAGTAIYLQNPASVDNLIYGNIFYGWQTGINFRDQVAANLCDYNDYFNNTANISTAATNGPNDKLLDPQFADWVHNDFTIGTNLKAAGFPGGFGNTNTTSYIDIGAVQRKEPTGGTGGTKGSIFLQ